MIDSQNLFPNCTCGYLAFLDLSVIFIIELDIEKGSMVNSCLLFTISPPNENSWVLHYQYPVIFFHIFQFM